MSSQKGIALILTLVILAVSLAIVFALAAVFLVELQASGLVVRSTKSFYAADSAVEQILFAQRKQSIFSSSGNGQVSPDQQWSYTAECITCQRGGQDFNCHEIQAAGKSGTTQRLLTARYIVSACQL